MKGTQSRVGFNEMLGCPLIEPFKPRFGSAPLRDIQCNYLYMRSGPTPELTRAEHKAFNTKEPSNDESHAPEASGSMSCWARL
jgi:hypothetical protein